MEHQNPRILLVLLVRSLEASGGVTEVDVNDTGDSLVVLDAGEAGEDLGKDRVFQLDG